MATEGAGLRVEERAVLKKYDGEPTADKEPVEIIELLDGKVVSHWKKGEDDAPSH